MYIKMERQVITLSLNVTKREVQEREFVRVREQANKKWTSDTSRKLFEKMHIRRLRELFDMIDTDRDGEISESSFVRADLPREALAVLRPLMKSGRKLDFSEFLE